MASGPAIRLGLETIYTPSDDPGHLAPLVDVIAVHGIGAHPDHTWTIGDVNWLKDDRMLPQAIPNSRILRFGYESQWLGKEAIQQRLPLVADQLLRNMMALRKKCPLRPLVFIGHCFGGIVIEKALVSAKLHEEDYPNIIRSVAGVIFLGTPHRGSNSQSKASVIASIASAISYGEHSSLLKVVEKDSEMLADLLHDFTRTVNTVSIPVFCFFEQHRSDVGKILKFKGSRILVPSIKDAIVDEHSGCLDGFPKLGLASDHFRINRFADPEDANYRLVSEEVIRFVDAAPHRINSRRESLPIIQPGTGEFDARNYVDSVSGTTVHVPAEFAEQHGACVQALFVTDPADDLQMIANKKDRLLEATDTWVLRDVTYLKWLEDDRSRVLWLHGDPGKGKTMLAIALIEEFSKRMQFDPSASNIALVYFFCDDQDDRRKSAPLILRGLIYQILCQRPDLAIYLHNEYEKQREQLFLSPNSLQTLWRVFHNIIRNSELREITIVIDALDECDTDSMELFLVLVEPYITNAEKDDLHQGFQNDASCHIKWLLTSRNDLRLRQPLIGSLDISLEANSSHVDEAVLKFIDVKVKHLTRLKHYDEALISLVETSLRQKAEGTFLWVALACRELSKPSVLSVNTEEALLQLPQGITPLYTRIMNQVLTSSDEKSTIYIKAILQSMIVAWRPLLLPELAVAAGLPEQYHHNLHVLGEYVEQCGSMVTVRERQAHFVHLSAKTYLRQAQFVHLSAKIYLLENGRGSIVSHDLGPEHRNIAVNCFRYVCRKFYRSPSSREPSPSPLKGRKTSDVHNYKNDDVVCLDYPILFWMEHAKHASTDIAEQFDISADFFKVRSDERQIWFRAYWAKTHAECDECPAEFTALHLAAYAGLPWLVLKLLNSSFDSDIYLRDSFGNQPLLWAARNGHEFAVKLLLDRQVSVAAKNNEGVTALYWAANNGHASIVLLLLKRGANCRPKDKIGWTPLHRATFNSHTDVVRILLDNGADIEATDDTKWTALMRAATMGDIKVTQCLLEASANLEIKDMEGCTPAHHAALNGHASIVELLVQYGADFETQDNEHWTVLHHASWNGHEKTVKYLLKKGANVHSRAENGWTALHQATWNGHVAVVKRLLKGGADLNEIDDEGETALHQAAWRGHVAVLKILLEEDADPNLKDRSGQTALHQAASNGAKEVVQLLLDEGADPRIEDSDGRKPHSLAEENFHHSTAKVLRERETELYDEEIFPDTDNIPKTSLPDSHVDPAIIEALSADPATATIEPYGQAGFSTPSKISVVVSGKSSVYFMKTGPDGDMFKGEHESLTAIHAAVPSFCPVSIKHGKLSSTDDYFLLTDFIDMEATTGGPSSGLSLAQKLAKLHSTPPPIPPGFHRPVFGCPFMTCVGRTRQDNSWSRSWPKFYAENRLRPVCRLVEKNHGTDLELTSLLDRIVKEVVPRLLGNGHLGGRKGVQPALVHGDLWTGNKARGRVGGKGGIEDVVFDPGCCYAHSEYELGIMRMFGGFSAGFFKEYHRLVPKTEPKNEYDDRLALYELYQWLNHYALFSGGYREDALDCMEKLVQKYGSNEEDDSNSS
ncbi:hypothetical protein MMC13_001067 [Lambiella insularis]|nr:hypothetical protein [Lambiella insularis]